MGNHPINLAVRFLLELVALISFATWGWKQTDGWFRFVLALAIPIISASIWGTFAVPNDPSRSGAAPIAISGILRLILELLFFAFAVWCVKDIDLVKTSIIYGFIILIHYILSYDRIHWLMSN